MELDTSYPKLQVKFCRDCHITSHVEDSRTDGDGTVRRRRICPKCRKVWYTVEVLNERSD